MESIIKKFQIKKELKRFEIFKQQYDFKQKEIVEKNGALFCDDICIKENADSEYLGECEKFVNVGYKLHGSLPKILSNLFPYEFYFRGLKLHSIESFFQGIKFKEKKAQKQVFKLSGLDSNNIKAAQDYSWKKDKVIYFMGKPYKRDSKDYERLIDELYVSLLQNPLYVDALKNVGEKYIIHAMGEVDINETVFTRYEFEKQLNCLKDYCILYK
jgi:hypothetical protein